MEQHDNLHITRCLLFVCPLMLYHVNNVLQLRGLVLDWPRRFHMPLVSILALVENDVQVLGETK